MFQKLHTPLKAVALYKAAAFFYVFSLGKLRRILYLLYAALETLWAGLLTFCQRVCYPVRMKADKYLMPNRFYTIPLRKCPKLLLNLSAFVPSNQKIPVIE